MKYVLDILNDVCKKMIGSKILRNNINFSFKEVKAKNDENSHKLEDSQRLPSFSGIKCTFLIVRQLASFMMQHVGWMIS